MHPKNPARLPSGTPSYINGPKPYEFTGFGDIYGPKPYNLIGFGDLENAPQQIRLKYPAGTQTLKPVTNHTKTIEIDRL